MKHNIEALYFFFSFFFLFSTSYFKFIAADSLFIASCLHATQLLTDFSCPSILSYLIPRYFFILIYSCIKGYASSYQAASSSQAASFSLKLFRYIKLLLQLKQLLCLILLLHIKLILHFKLLFLAQLLHVVKT